MAQPLQQPQPQPQPQKAFPVGWDQLIAIAALAWRLAGAGPFEAIVCVTRGGLVPAAIVARELGIRLIETVRGELQPRHPGRAGAQGRGAQYRRHRRRARQGRADRRRPRRYRQDRQGGARHPPEAHFATVYAKPMGRPMVDTFITEVSQDTWIYFPWDTGLAFQPPIRDGDL